MMPANIQMLEHEMRDRLAAKNAELAASRSRIAELEDALKYYASGYAYDGTPNKAWKVLNSRAK